MSALWYPAAVRRPGPARKVHGTRSASVVKHAIYHSAEGYWAALMATLDSRTVPFAWHLSNPVTGPIVQHFGLDAVVWHVKDYNTPAIGVENEGKEGEPLSLSQTQNLVEFSAWLVNEGWIDSLTRPSANLRVEDATLLEHNEVGRYIADPPYVTECPSDRIPWDAIMEDAMLQKQVEGLMTIVADLGKITKNQQAQIEGLMWLAADSAHKHSGDAVVPAEELVEVKALAEENRTLAAENRARLEALGAAASGE